MVPLRIYSDKITPRLEYACRIIFDIIWQVPFELAVTPASIPAAEDHAAIYYTVHPPGNRFCIFPSGLVFEKEVHPVNPEVSWQNGLPILFPARVNCKMGFDIFSAVFYMVSRYEEYLPFRPDKFGRFPEVESLSAKFDFTHLPVVHLWASLLQKKLKTVFNDLNIPARKPTAIFTYDIDVAFAYCGRSFLTHVLSLGKDLLGGQFKNIQRKLSHGFGLISDPSDTYKTLENNPLQKIYFFLLSDKKTMYDRNIHLRSPVLQKLILRLKEHKCGLGIHPSYYSSDHPDLISKEKKYLQDIISQPVTQSRQHFLRFRLPDTFRELLKAGIAHDYSMHYPDMPGFRSGMCLPYPFFDLLANETTNLWLHPGCIMETTFRDDLNIPAEKSLEWYISLWEQVKKVGGEFICIWHNDTLWDNLPDDNTLAFKQVHDKLIQIIKEDLNEKNP